MKITEGFVYKELVGNRLMIPIGQQLLNGKQIVVLYDEDMFYMNYLLDGPIQKDRLLELYVENENCTKEEGLEKLDQFIDISVELGFLEMETEDN